MIRSRFESLRRNWFVVHNRVAERDSLSSAEGKERRTEFFYTTELT